MYSRSKKKVCLVANSDFISNLPETVTDQILVRLPIREAVRTSVLSTQWRYKWTTIPELVFHDDQVLPSPHNDQAKLINFIDRVLLLHTGFIHKFELSSRCLLSFSTIDCWILFLLRKNIKELVLNFSHRVGVSEKYKLPTCFFSAQQISTLELHYCVLKPPPPTFTGFSYLKSLCLRNTTFVNDGEFKFLISKCPVLERLTLINVNGVNNHLNLCSPNLKYLCLYSCFQGICFENSPLLSDVSINSSSALFDVVKCLSSLPNLRKLVVGQYFQKFLTVSKIAEKLPFTCHHLNNLSIHLNFEDVNEICVTLCLLNSSPNLRELEIHSNPFSKLLLPNGENFWEERTLIHWNMSGLRIVKITDIRGCKLKLEFIKLLLANSLMLEMLIIRSGELNNDRKGLEFLKELVTFPRASPKARIKFFERNEK